MSKECPCHGISASSQRPETAHERQTPHTAETHLTNKARSTPGAISPLNRHHYHPHPHHPCQIVSPIRSSTTPFFPIWCKLDCKFRFITLCICCERRRLSGQVILSHESRSWPPPPPPPILCGAERSIWAPHNNPFEAAAAAATSIRDTL